MLICLHELKKKKKQVTHPSVQKTDRLKHITEESILLHQALKYIQAFNITIVSRSAMQYASQKYLINYHEISHRFRCFYHVKLLLN